MLVIRLYVERWKQFPLVNIELFNHFLSFCVTQNYLLSNLNFYENGMLVDALHIIELPINANEDVISIFLL